MVRACGGVRIVHGDLQQGVVVWWLGRVVKWICLGTIADMIIVQNENRFTAPGYDNVVTYLVFDYLCPTHSSQSYYRYFDHLPDVHIYNEQSL